MKEQIKIYFIMSGLMFCTLSYGQNYEQDMLKIKQAISKYHSLSMKMVFRPYDSLSKVTDSMSGRYYRTDNSFYYRIGSGAKEVEYVKNNTHYLIIDHRNKAVSISKSTESTSQTDGMQKIESLISSKAMQVKYKELDNNRGEYDVVMSSAGAWNGLSIVFNKSNYMLNEIFMYSAEKGQISGMNFNKPVVGIYYSNYSEMQPDNGMFSDSRYIISSGNRTIPVESYKGFKVYDFLNNN